MRNKLLILISLLVYGSCSDSKENLLLDANGKTPVVKEFPKDFEALLTQRGTPMIYTRENSENFEYIGMPIGGIGAGQLYIGGDGKLWFWDIFNTNYRMGQLKGEEAYEFPYKRSEEGQYGTIAIEQGFAIKVTTNSGEIIKKLDRNDIEDIAFMGQYPIATISYADEQLPISIELESFSPFSPLDLNNSSYPATIFNFTLKNTSNNEVNAEFGGWLENAVLIESRKEIDGKLMNQVRRNPFKSLELISSASSLEVPKDTLLGKYDYGTMSLTLLDKDQDNYGVASIHKEHLPAKLFNESEAHMNAMNTFNDDSLVGGIVKKLILKPGESKQLSFLISWHFANSRVAPIVKKKGKSYNNQFKTASAVSQHIVNNFENLTSKTRLWKETWYNSTLPYWFLDRTFLNTSILASSTSHIFENGQFYGFEGAYQGLGTCTHVWGYVQAMGRLFPELEVSLRAQTDFSPFPDGGLFSSGVVNFRGREQMGEGWGHGMAVDGQAGIVLRSYLSHQMSVNDAFLKAHYESIKTVMNGLIAASDTDHDGILTGPQHNTLDADWYGKITWLSLQYQAALRAMGTMAKEMGDYEYESFCLNAANTGRKYIEENLFNGEYFIQEADPNHLDAPGVYTGCEYSQLLGQSWAYQLGLGEIIDPKKATSALNSLWKYNFTTDVGPYRKVKPKGRWYALPGEGGFVACTWPNGGSEVLEKGNPRFAAYNNESQNGYEYALSHLMMSHGMPLKSLAHTWYMNNNRYHGSKRNPWCEVEWGIHYSRSMASYGLFTAVSGFQYHGPQKRISFGPKIQQDNFKSAFVTAEGWGSFSQKTSKESQNETLEVHSGRLEVKTLTFEIVDKKKVSRVSVLLNGEPILASFENLDENSIQVQLGTIAELEEGSILILYFQL